MARSRVHREAAELIGFQRRMARAMVKRAEGGELEALSALADARRAFDAAISEAARALRIHGYTWADIGAELGVTKQAAQKRFGEDD